MMVRSFSLCFRSLLEAAAWGVLVACFGIVSALPASAETEHRVALVIGNGGYKSVPALPNPVNDAKAVAASLKRLGFDVTDGYDLTIAEMRAKIAAFFGSLPDSKAAVIYYAGHGVSVDGENYLVPTDVSLKGPADLDLQAIDMSLFLKQLKREERANVIILDACRDNPFAGDLAHAKTRAMVSDRGLIAINNDLAKGTLIAYASDPNSTALDGKPGDGSPFTKALLHHLEDSNVPIGTVMDRVRTEVWDETKNRQMPWVNTSLIGEFILNPQGKAPVSLNGVPLQEPDTRAPTPADRFALENRLWDSAEHGNTREDYQAYIESYPSGLYAPMAKSRIAKLTASEPKDSQPRASAAETQAAEAIKTEVGTERTEAAINLTAQTRKELQARLSALAFNVGGITGTIGPKTRSAILAWQKSHGVPPTGWLGPLQYAALQKETDAAYKEFLVAQPAAPSGQRVARSRSVARFSPPPHRRSVTHSVSERRTRPSGATSGGMDPASAAMFGGMIGGLIGHFR